MWSGGQTYCQFTFLLVACRGMEWNRRKEIMKTIYLPAIGSPPLNLYIETQSLWLLFSCLIMIVCIKQYYVFNFYIVFIADVWVCGCFALYFHVAYFSFDHVHVSKLLFRSIQLSSSSSCILLCVCVLRARAFIHMSFHCALHEHAIERCMHARPNKMSSCLVAVAALGEQ